MPLMSLATFPVLAWLVVQVQQDCEARLEQLVSALVAVEEDRTPHGQVEILRTMGLVVRQSAQDQQTWSLAVGKGFNVGNGYVHAQVALLLAGGGDPETSAEELRRGASLLADEWHEAWNAEEESDSAEYRDGIGPGYGFGRSPRQQLEAAVQAVRHLESGAIWEAIDATLDELDGGRLTATVALSMSLQVRGGDLGVEGLAELLGELPFDARSVFVIAALKSLGSQDAASSLLNEIARGEELWKKAEKERKTWERKKPGRPPRDVKGESAKSRWIEREQEMINRKVEHLARRVERVELWMGLIASNLRMLAEEQELLGPPKKPIPARSWDQWFGKVRNQLPESLRVVDNPIPIVVALPDGDSDRSGED